MGVKDETAAKMQQPAQREPLEKDAPDVFKPTPYVKGLGFRL